MDNLMTDWQKALSPEKAAKIIIKGMIRNKREILVGKSELMMLHIRRYLPWLFFRIADKIKSVLKMTVFSVIELEKHQALQTIH